MGKYRRSYRPNYPKAYDNRPHYDKLFQTVSPWEFLITSGSPPSGVFAVKESGCALASDRHGSNPSFVTYSAVQSWANSLTSLRLSFLSSDRRIMGRCV